MKTYIILVSLVIAVSAAEWKLKTQQERNAIIAECDKRFPDPLPDEVQERAHIEKIIPIEMIPEMLCNLRGFGVWSDSEGFIVDRIMIAFDHQNKEQYVDREKFHRDFISCQDKNTQKSSINEWAHRTFSCFVRDKEFWEVLRHVKVYAEDGEKY